MTHDMKLDSPQKCMAHLLTSLPSRYLSHVCNRVPLKKKSLYKCNILKTMPIHSRVVKQSYPLWNIKGFQDNMWHETWQPAEMYGSLPFLIPQDAFCIHVTRVPLKKKPSLYYFKNYAHAFQGSQKAISILEHQGFKTTHDMKRDSLQMRYGSLPLFNIPFYMHATEESSTEKNRLIQGCKLWSLLNSWDIRL